MGGEHSLSFDGLEGLLEKIYGDQISDDPFEPQEIHLALGQDQSTMKVMWVTMQQALEEPFVEYMAAGESDWAQSATVVSARNYTYEVPQKWWPVFEGMIYEADMAALQPGAQYQYRVGGYDSVNATTRRSAVFPFRAAPAAGDPDRDTRIAALADHGTFELLGFATVDKMVAVLDEQPDAFEMVFVAGDLSYAGLSTDMPRLNISKEDEFERIWDLLGIQNQPVAARVPWMVGDGNHERFYNWSAFTNRYQMPQSQAQENPSGGNFWYSFDYGNVHWVSASSEHDLTEGSEQLLFLQRDLEAAVVNRAQVPWIVFSLHKPFYCSDDGTPGGYADLLEETLLRYDVDLTITGHMHCYERVHPVKGGEVTVWPQKQLLSPPAPPGVAATTAEAKEVEMDVYYLSESGTGPVHVVQGHAGGMQAERWLQPQPMWSAVRMANGYVPPNNTDAAVAATVTTMQGEEVPLDLSDGSPLRSTDIPQVPLLPRGFSEEDERSVYYSDTYGFGIIRAVNSTHMYYSSVLDTDNNVAGDQFWIVRERR